MADRYSQPGRRSNDLSAAQHGARSDSYHGGAHMRSPPRGQMPIATHAARGIRQPRSSREDISEAEIAPEAQSGQPINEWSLPNAIKLGSHAECITKSFMPGNQTQFVIGGRNVLKLLCRSSDGGLVEKVDFRRGKKTVNLSYSASDAMWCPSSAHKSLVVTSAFNGSVVYWDVERAQSSRQVCVCQEHERAVNTLSWQGKKDNPLLASAGLEGVIHIRDVQGNIVNRIKEGNEAIRQLAFNPFKHEEVATVGDAKMLKVWDIRKASSPVHSMSAAYSPMFTLSWHPTLRNVIATGGRDKKVHVWSLDGSGGGVKTAPTHTINTVEAIAGIRWRPGFVNQLLTFSQLMDTSLRLWDLGRPTVPIASFQGHKDIVTDFLWSDDSNPSEVISVSRDQTAMRQNLQTAVFPAETLPAEGCSWHPTGLLTVSHCSVDRSRKRAMIPSYDDEDRRSGFVEALLARQDSRERPSLPRPSLVPVCGTSAVCSFALPDALSLTVGGRGSYDGSFISMLQEEYMRATFQQPACWEDHCVLNAEAALACGAPSLHALWNICACLFPGDTWQEFCEYSRSGKLPADLEFIFNTKLSQSGTPAPSSQKGLSRQSSMESQSGRSSNPKPDKNSESNSIDLPSNEDDGSEELEGLLARRASIDGLDNNHTDGTDSQANQPNTESSKPANFKGKDGQEIGEVARLQVNVSVSAPHDNTGLPTIPRPTEAPLFGSGAAERSVEEHDILATSTSAADSAQGNSLGKKNGILSRRFRWKHSGVRGVKWMHPAMAEDHSDARVNPELPLSVRAGLLKEFVYKHAHSGDLQTACLVCSMLGPDGLQVLGIDIAEACSWSEDFIELLRRLRRHDIAAMFMKQSPFQSISSLSMQSTTLAVRCGRCNQPMQGLGDACNSCKQTPSECILCRLPIRGCSTICPACGSICHSKCILSWMRTRPSCPMCMAKQQQQSQSRPATAKMPL